MSDFECLSPFVYRDFLKSDGSDSDSDDDKRVIKSARDKRLGELASCCDEIRVGSMNHNSFRRSVNRLISGFVFHRTR